MNPTEFYQAYVFDLDGTIYLGDHLLPGAARLIEELRRRELPVRFLSNNPTKDPQQYVEKLTKLGLPTDISDIANTSEIDVVVASYDRTFDYAKLQTAFDAIWFHRRAILIQTNPDRFCPFPGGRGEPDCAAITAAIEACTGVKSQANLGKPSPGWMWIPHAASWSVTASAPTSRWLLTPAWSRLSFSRVRRRQRMSPRCQWPTAPPMS